MQLFDWFLDKRRDRGEDPTSDQRCGSEGWHSFTNLFSDGARAGNQTPTSAWTSPVFPSIAPSMAKPKKDSWDALGDEASSQTHVNAAASDEDLVELRMDICDINETLRYHDLWVKDAEATRRQVEHLQETSDGYKAWLENITCLLRAMKAREVTLVGQVEGLRLQLEKVEHRVSCPAETLEMLGAISVASLSGSRDPAHDLQNMAHDMGEQHRELVPPALSHDDSFQIATKNEFDNLYLAMTLKAQEVEHSLRNQVVGLESLVATQLHLELSGRKAEDPALREGFETLLIRGLYEHLDVYTVTRRQAWQCSDVLAGGPSSLIVSGIVVDLSEEAGTRSSGAKADGTSAEWRPDLGCGRGRIHSGLKMALLSRSTF